MQDNVLKEIWDPQSQPRQTQVVKTHQIVRDAKNYELYTFPKYKCYQLVYDKQAIDPVTFQTYPYRYEDAVDWTFFRFGSRPGTFFFSVSKEKKGHPPSRGQLMFPVVKQKMLPLIHVWKIVFFVL